ncbi:FIG041266: ATP-dependent nuclease subunit B [hydrothermal vent metagenome]|uniref:FIG041266: ATP-dependent nuclease subunit B n=1 Tax=hydrothermal vent metagenome TaxID=652676 RepID=A0A3B0UJY7_9ZZZZ
MKNKVFSISSTAPFLKTLVTSVLEGPLLPNWPKSNPFWLSDVTIILPTRRACLALSEIFAEAQKGAAMLPDIRTFDDEEEQEELFSPFVDAPVALNAISPMERRFLLARLIEAWAKTHPDAALVDPTSKQLNPTRILQMADSLARLIDDFEIEQVPPAALRQIMPENLPKNGQLNMDFLEIILSAWPEILGERKQVDLWTLKNLKLQKQAQTLQSRFGGRPVIAAGSTGSVPASAQLMAAIIKLERGALVLPGLDTSLDKKDFARLLDIDACPHGHPQYGLARLLSRLKQTPQSVIELAGKQETRRNELVRASLALAGQTAHWHDIREKFSAPDIKNATKDIMIAKARTEQEQALAIAIAARNALEKNQTVGIISPDRNLARRIIAGLKRFDITVDDSAGMALFHSRAGRLARQVLALFASNIGPVDLMALLNNRYVTFGRTRQQMSNLAHMIEFSLLRGQRPMPGFAGLHQLVAHNVDGALPHAARQLDQKDAKKILRFLDDLKAALAPVFVVFAQKSFPPAQLGAAIVETIAALRIAAPKETSPQLPGAKELASWAQALKETPLDGPALSALDSSEVLEVLMAGFSVRKPGTYRHDIAIWGRLEARLQSADLIILSALNEGSWPEIADPGPWLSRGMRLKAGLEPPERQHGLAAHDFEMAMGGQKIILAFSERVGTSPAARSRLVQRFLGFVGNEASSAMLERGDKLLRTARMLDQAAQITPASRPAPSPPARVRPKSLSVTEIETLIRSPYDLYAKYVLSLKPLDPLGEEVGARERGNLVHEIFARFIDEEHDVMAENSAQIMHDIASEIFSALEAAPDRRDIWLRRFQTVIEGFLHFERNRQANVLKRHAEKNLRWTFPIAGKDFTLRGRADRIDILSDNSVEIIDFKTGSIPAPSDMKSFLAPQMLLEAAIVKACGFDGGPPATSSALTYIKIGAGPEAFKPSGFVLPDNMDMAAASNEIIKRLEKRAELYLFSDHQPMHPGLLPKQNQNFRGAYDHLARSDEWALVDGVEGEN